MWVGKLESSPYWDVYAPDGQEAAKVWLEEQARLIGFRSGVRYDFVCWRATQADCWFTEIKADGVVYARLPGTFESAEAARASFGTMTPYTLPAGQRKLQERKR